MTVVETCTHPVQYRYFVDMLWAGIHQEHCAMCDLLVERARSGQLEAERDAARGELALLRAFVNTWQTRDQAAQGNNAANAKEMQTYLREVAEQTS